jgi:hypothetical protein
MSTELWKVSMILETKFLHLRRPAALGEALPDGWRVTWLGGWDKGRVFFVVMVVRKIDAAKHAGMPVCR